MKTYIVIGATLLVGVVLGYVLNLRTVIVLRKRLRNTAKKPETAKRVVWACLTMGFAWVWCSYVLAYLDKAQIAESLSQVAVTEIIGVVLVYCLKSLIENLSKNNSWPDKQQVSNQDPPDEEGGVW